MHGNGDADQAQAAPKEPAPWVSARAAGGILASAGLGREAARRLLLTGVAGAGMPVGGAVAYEATRVRALRDWPFADPETAERAFVVLLGRGQEATPFEHLGDLGWRADVLTRLRISLAVAERERFPFVATVSGFVVAAGDIVDVGVKPVPRERERGRERGRERERPRERGRATFTLEPAGEWFARYRNRRLALGPGSHWRFWPEASLTQLLTDETFVERRTTRREERRLGGPDCFVPPHRKS